jgi:translation elongation factor EF-Tu-like GTPase
VIFDSALAAATGGDDVLGRQAVLKLMETVDNYFPEPVSYSISCGLMFNLFDASIQTIVVVA